jgi:sugar lactone lactonase YvrE
MQARLVLDVKNIVGESLVWSGREQALYWVDIGGMHVHRFDPASGTHESWPTPEIPTSIGLRARGGFIVGLRREVCFWRPDGGFERVAIPEPDLIGNRLNEGRVAPDGSFWVGTMQDNLTEDGAPKAMDRDSGAYFRIGPDLKVAQLTPREYGITNTMAWLPDGRFITADTTKNTLYAFDYDAKTSALSNRRVFAAGLDRGLPDGSCLDAEGHLWNCRVVGGACLARFSAHGRLDQLVELPCSWPTSCAFGGPDLSTLYVTSARFTMADDHLISNPQEGGLFAVEVGRRGMPEYLFAG